MFSDYRRHTIERRGALLQRVVAYFPACHLRPLRPTLHPVIHCYERYGLMICLIIRGTLTAEAEAILHPGALFGGFPGLANHLPTSNIFIGSPGIAFSPSFPVVSRYTSHIVIHMIFFAPIVRIFSYSTITPRVSISASDVPRSSPKF